MDWVMRARADLARLLGRLSEDELYQLRHDWALKAHAGQQFPTGRWRLWMMMAGRGFGKTRVGAEWVSELARRDGSLRFALVGATIDEVAQVMIRGESGLMQVARPDEDVIWRPATRTVTFSTGALGFAYSGENPDKLRGPEHHYAWCDELAKWSYPEETWDNLMLGLRLGRRPRTLVTTTPRPIALVRRLAAEADRLSGGATFDNPHLPEAFVEGVAALYGGTRFARQELLGEIVEEVAGALWTRAMLDKARVMFLPGTGRWLAEGETEGSRPPDDGTLVASGAPSTTAFGGGPPPRSGEDFVRVVIGVDPPASRDGDACGIVACALDARGVGHVLADHSVGGLSPEGWARAVAAAAEAHRADRVVAEANQGGDMVASVLKAADCALPVRLVRASRGKAARAEPVAALFESGRVRLHGRFPELEDQLCGLAIGGAYEGPGRSPDRADAMVWALTELMLTRGGEPVVRGL
jgi:phage terminase large subunit-like protein